MRRFACAALAAAAGAVATVAWAVDTPLSGSVGPGFSISVLDAQGNRVSNLAPGPYALQVQDLSEEHNFNLSGPGGIDVATDIVETGTTTFPLTLVDGTYTFLCNAHPTRMRGEFTVGSGGSQPPSPPPTGGGPPSPTAAVGATLVLTAGPGATITFRTRAGKAVKVLRPGAYTIVVRDRTARHNAHLVGAGVNRRTAKAQLVSATWKVTLRKGTLVFRSDFRASMRGAVTVA
jgi:plastocyanin